MCFFSEGEGATTLYRSQAWVVLVGTLMVGRPFQGYDADSEVGKCENAPAAAAAPTHIKIVPD